MLEPYRSNKDWEDRGSPLQRPYAASDALPKPAAKRKPKVKRSKLTLANIGALWSRLRRAVECFCDAQRGACPLIVVSRNEIRFRLTEDHDEVQLTLNGRRVSKKIRRHRQSIPIVKLRTGAAGFDYGSMRYSAMRLVLEAIHEARRERTQE
jgi:hypothetical protein